MPRGIPGRNRTIRIIDSLTNCDLAPLDEELQELKNRIEQLENARRLILVLKGNSNGHADAKRQNSAAAKETIPQPPPSCNGSGKSTKEPSKQDKTLADKFFLHLRANPGESIAEICGYFDVDRLAVLRVLHNDARFESNNDGLWSIKG